MLLSQELARRYSPAELVSVAVHPGVIASDIWRRIPGPARWVMTRFMKSPAEGAETSVYCATSPDVSGASGSFFAACRAKQPSSAATPALAAELWTRSEEWVRE